MYSRESSAQRALLLLGGGGLVLSVLGLLLAISQWPDESDVFEESGSAGLAYLGVALCGVGQLAILVALIGVGVGLGIRWSGISDTVTDAAWSARRLAEAGQPDDERSSWSKIPPLGPARDT